MDVIEENDTVLNIFNFYSSSIINLNQENSLVGKSELLVYLQEPCIGFYT